MKSFHQFLIVNGLIVQGLGLAVAPRRFRGLLAGLALGVDLAWFLWYLNDDRGLAITGFWALSPVATWIAIHLVLAPGVGVQALARLVPRWRWWVRGVGCSLVLVAYGWCLGEAYGPPLVTRATVAFADLPPAFDGYRIVLLGDIHAGLFAGTRTVNRWARAAGDLHGDLLVGAGDFISFREEEAERTGVAFEGVVPPDGRIAILGNHDQLFSDDEVAERLRRHGWTVLEDESLAITRAGQRLVLLGAMYDGSFRGTGTNWKGKPWPEGFRIGLCHTPVMWPRMVKEGARLTLAAHTHGGQVNLSPLFNAAEEFTPYVHGLYRHGASILFVTQGLGLTSIPVRFRCRPELVVITLRRP